MSTIYSCMWILLLQGFPYFFFNYGLLCFVALYCLNVERCSITSRTVQKVADALDSQSILSQLCLGILDFLNTSLTIFNRFFSICSVGF